MSGFSTGLKGLEVADGKVFDRYIPDEKVEETPPDYSEAIPIGRKLAFPDKIEDYDDRGKWSFDGVAEMQVRSSDRVLICDKTGGAKTSLLKLVVFGLWEGGQKVIHLSDVKNDFANIDEEDGVPEPFVEAAGLPAGQEPQSLPVQVFQPRLLYNEYRRGLPEELDEEDLITYAYGFQDLRESEVKHLVHTTPTQDDILTNALARAEEPSFDSIVSLVDGSDANHQAKRSLLNSIIRLKEQEVLEDEYREVLPVDRLGDGVVTVSMDNFTSFKGDSIEKLEVQIAIALRRIKQGLRDGVLSGSVTIVFDEAHEFCSEENEISTEEIVDMIDLGRAYDIPMVFSTQRPSQLDSEIVDGVSHFFIGPNVPPKQRMDLLRAADLVDHEDYSTGKWTKIFRNIRKHEFLQVDRERSLWRVVSPFAPPCYHPWKDD